MPAKSGRHSHRGGIGKVNGRGTGGTKASDRLDGELAICSATPRAEGLRWGRPGRWRPGYTKTLTAKMGHQTVEKLRYLHHYPVKRGSVVEPERRSAAVVAAVERGG